MPHPFEDSASRRKRSASQNAALRSSTAVAPMISKHNYSNSSISTRQPPINYIDLLEPAVEGPPSPERIRQLNKQMKRASHLNRGYGHRAASSGSSSLQSLTGERPGWEQAMDNTSLTRQSSTRSTASSSPSKERPDGVQVMGKNIFHRRGKLSKSKRESSAPSSSGSSLYSTETPNDSSFTTLKETFIPTIFSRRKPSRDESVYQKKVQISGPFNFQHVTHTPRDQSSSRPDVVTKPLEPQAPGQGLHFRSPFAEDMGDGEFSVPRPQLVPRHTAPAFGARRLLKHSRSQDQLRVSPPRPVRPPRSPIEPTSSPTLPPFGPVPPPRISSRQSMQPDCDPLAATALERPLTSNGFRRPQPFSPDEGLDQTTTPPYGGYTPQSDLEEFIPDETRFSHAISTPDEVAWPLMNPSTTSFETPLPDVPEEEDEHFVVSQRPRFSLASNNSSLRGSHSVPLLRALSQSQRPMSGASDTLGRLDTCLTSQGFRDGLEEFGTSEISPIRESWEDDIDYCYEHEADANFNYEWERPSLDVGRENAPPPVQIALADDELMEATPSSTTRSSPGMLSASNFDVPALSPVSQASSTAGLEVTTPSSTLAVANNFSFPRGENGLRPSNLRHSRTDSQASSFKESHGFTLSPSLLIPGDYHQQMLLTEAEKQGFPYDEEFLSKSTGSLTLEEVHLVEHRSPSMFHSRSSIATTATNSTTISDSTGERHVSTNSTWTNLSRFTSSTSLNKLAESWAEDAECIPEAETTNQQDASEDDTTPPASNDTVPELTAFPSVPSAKKSFHKSHASESVVRNDIPPMKSAEAIKGRRPRARTASLSTQAPPVGQYALFPRTYVKGNGDRI